MDADAGVLETVSTTCSFCGTGCGLEVTHQDNAIVTVRGDKSSPVNHGETCVKGLQAWKYAQSPNRLRYPLVRKEGVLTRATWSEAISTIAASIKRNLSRHTADAFGCLSSSRATNEMNYVAQKFMRQVIGTNNIDSCNRT
ncbi:molybdopterin-dependent oxidoreductase [Alicyclobacillus sp. SO9]|nr:molybdopterin-dependent oxidoreductase [Alicyclobacillus sp. SO9]